MRGRLKWSEDVSKIVNWLRQNSGQHSIATIARGVDLTAARTKVALRIGSSSRDSYHSIDVTGSGPDIRFRFRVR